MTLKNRRAIKLPTTKPVASLLTSSDMAVSLQCLQENDAKGTEFPLASHRRMADGSRYGIS